MGSTWTARHVLLAAAALAAALPLVLGEGTICRTSPPGATLNETAIVVWGQETMVAFGCGFRAIQGAKPGVEGPWLAPPMTGLILFLVAGHLIITAPRGQPLPLLFWTIAFYPLGTGIVELARVNFDASRYGFITATWHNLPEYIILHHLFFTREKAEKLFPLALLWVWFLDVFILFVPSFDGVRRGVFFAGLAAQLTGICCDHLLVITFFYLWVTTEEPLGSPLKHTYFMGLAAAIMHMVEIVPLVILLSGFTTRPYLPISILVAFSSPITFYLYNRFVKSWIGPAQARTSAKQPIPTGHAWGLLVLGVSVGLANILAPAAIFPACPPPTGVAAAMPATAAAVPSLASCTSKYRLTGTTTVIAKPGKGHELVDLVSTMPGPIRLEEGNIYYHIASNVDTNDTATTVKFFESWSNIRTLYKHIYTSSTVSGVFRGPEFKDIVTSQVLEGPFESVIPCDEANTEVQPIKIPFSTIIDAPMDCLWAKFSNWCGDHSWVQNSLDVECLTPNLRKLRFKTAELLVLNQSAPLSRPTQPEGGHRLIYHVLSGGFVGTVGETYAGDLTIVPAPGDPSKTLFKYEANIIAINASLSQAYYKRVYDDFTYGRIPFLRKWGAEAALNCTAQASAAVTHPA